MLYSKAPEFSAFCFWVLCFPPRVPELLCFPCRARVPSTAGRPRAPATPLPSSTHRLAIPSTARAFPAVLSSLCHVGPPEPSVRHETEEVRRRRSPSCAQTRDLSPPLLLLSSSGVVPTL
jgi:hypothetical protein